MSRKPVITKDGSLTVLHEEMNITYHSLHGAMTESLHVFIKEGLECRLKFDPPSPLRVFEMGLGTGLNALLTAQHSSQRANPVHYTAVEAFPLEKEVIESLDYGDPGILGKIHAAEWDKEVPLLDHFTLLKRHSTLDDFLESNQHKFDLVFYDAFAPRSQPELWTTEVFGKVKAMMNPGGIFVTYCSKADVRRSLQEVGFIVEKIPGPPGKREMLRAKAS